MHHPGAPQQDGQFGQGPLPSGLQRRQAGLHLAHQAFGAHHIQGHRGAGPIQPAAQGAALLHQRQGLAGHLQALAVAAGLQPGTGGFRGHHHPQPIFGGPGRLGIGPGGIGQAVQAAEQVGLPLHIQADPIAAAGADVLAVLQGGFQLVVGGTAVAGAGRHLGGRLAQGIGFAQQRPGLQQVGRGHPQVAVLAQGFLYRGIEPRVTVELPPLVEPLLGRCVQVAHGQGHSAAGRPFRPQGATGQQGAQAHAGLG
ncbi:hypothetical protein PBOI14_53850 [Pseudomonas sp. Boi14]|nr:hypothetical protein PBOI14_53850 [Pseudomonas sp. Boi14]